MRILLDGKPRSIRVALETLLAAPGRRLEISDLADPNEALPAACLAIIATGRRGSVSAPERVQNVARQIATLMDLESQLARGELTASELGSDEFLADIVRAIRPYGIDLSRLLDALTPSEVWN